MISLVVADISFAQNTLVTFGTYTKHFPNMEVSAALKDEHGRYSFPEHFEKKLAIQDEQTGEIMNPQFEQGVFDVTAFEATLATDTTTTSKQGTDVIIMFDASSDALSNYGTQMKDLAIRVIRLLNFDHGDRFNFLRCGSSPLLVNSNDTSWLTVTDTTAIINYINTISDDAMIDLESAFYGDPNSLLNVNGNQSTINYGPFSSKSSQAQLSHSIFMIMGNDYQTLTGTGADIRKALDNSFFQTNARLRGIFFNSSDTLQFGDYNSPSYDTNGVLLADDRYLANCEIGWLSAIVKGQVQLGPVRSIDRQWLYLCNVNDNTDSVLNLCFDNLQNRSFPYRFGIINVKASPASIAMKPDTFKYKFSSNALGFDKDIEFLNPAKASVAQTVNIRQDVQLYPTIASDHITVQTQDNTLYGIFSPSGKNMLARQKSNELTRFNLPTGAYLIMTQQGETAKFVVVKN